MYAYNFVLARGLSFNLYKIFKGIWQLGIKETVSVQNEKKLWVPNFLWAGSRLRNYLTRNKSHMLQKRKEISQRRTKTREGTPKGGEEPKVREPSPN